MSALHKPLLTLCTIGVLVCGFSAGFGTAARAAAAEVSPQGRALEKMYDSMGVTERWIARHHVSWKTGLPDGKPVSKKGSHTHCSAFVAAVAYRLGIYILRPPEHPQIHLANAQMDWLETEETSRGWKAVESGQQAQELANQGFLVVAAYKNPKPKAPGHIALVRPMAKSDDALRDEGPQVMQAGMDNSASISLRQGFRHHRRAVDRGEIRYFAHAVKPDRLKEPGL